MSVAFDELTELALNLNPNPKPEIRMSTVQVGWADDPRFKGRVEGFWPLRRRYRFICEHEHRDREIALKCAKRSYLALVPTINKNERSKPGGTP